MSEKYSRQKEAGVYIDSSEIDISNAVIDPALSKVWSDDTSGELAVSIDRLLFDGLCDVAARYLEPHGFALNLENLLATIDSMRLSVIANTSSKKGQDGRVTAKKLLPAISMHLPRKKSIGPLLQRFYDEVGRYESELARLQEFESKSKRVVDAAIKDESGRKAMEILRAENLSLRDELARLSKKIGMVESALRAVPVSNGDNQLPSGIRSCVVRSIRFSEGVVQLKSGDQQYSISLKLLGGIPQQNARALSFHEGGVLKSVWMFDPALQPFAVKLATVLAVDGRRAKIRFDDRTEHFTTLTESQSTPVSGTRVLARFAGGYLIDVLEIGGSLDHAVVDRIYDKQTSRQIEDAIEKGSYD